MMPCLSLILAQSDGEILHTIKEPGFAQFIVYLLVLVMIGDKIYNWVNRGKAGKMEVTGSVEASEKARFVTAPEFEKLQVQVQGLSEVSASQHNAALLAGEKRVTNLSQVMDQETAQITERIETLQQGIEDKIQHGFERLSDKLHDVANTAAAQGGKLEGLDKRIEDLSKRYTDAIPKIHDRIDDAMKAATEAAALAKVSSCERA